MRFVVYFVASLTMVAGVAFGQAMTEVGAAVAGGSIGGAAGKQVSDSISTIFGKVDEQTAKAAKTAKTAPAAAPKPAAVPEAIQIGPGVPRRDSVPPPPPLRPKPGRRGVAAAKVEAPKIEPAQVVQVEQAPVMQLGPPPPPPAPKFVTADDLALVTRGMLKADLLKLGRPSFRITMFEDGHLVEVFRYVEHESPIGSVRLSDGEVASITVGR